MRLITIAIIVSMCLLPTLAQAQKQEKERRKSLFWFLKPNRYDRDGNYHGRWKVYFGDDKVLIRNGRFRHGREVGTWKYYYTDGTRYMVEKYSRRNNDIQVKKYHENGKLARVGMARLLQTSTMDRYFWFGDWQVYDSEGNYSHTEIYQGGNLIGRK